MNIDEIVGGNFKKRPFKILEKFTVVPHFLSKRECTSIINGFEQEEKLENCGNRLRLQFDSQELADWLWNRAEDYLPFKRVLDPYRSKERWIAYGLNPHFRLAKYKPSGNFPPHEDGFYEKSATERSFGTFMIYLNDVEVKNGGATHFIEYNLRIQPSEGLCVMFLVDGLLHEGEMCNSTKYILRTDVMYRLNAVKDLEIRNLLFEQRNKAYHTDSPQDWKVAFETEERLKKFNSD